MNTQSHIFVYQETGVAGQPAGHVLALVLAACQSNASPYKAQAAVPKPTATSAPAPTTAPMASPTLRFRQKAVINVAMDPKLGNILVDGKGMTLYMFTKDEARQEQL